MIGEKLQVLLDSRNLKPGTLATQTGIPKSTIYSILKRNNKNVNLSVMEKIAAAFDVPVDYFFDRPCSEIKEKPITEEGDGLEDMLIQRLMSLTPEELSKVDAFVQGLLASR